MSSDPSDQDPQAADHAAEHDFTGPLQPKTAKMLRLFFAGSALLLIADFVIHRHSHPGVDSLPGFYPVYGFAGCVVLVLVAKEMRKLVMRDEDYYESLSDDEEAQP